jgi:hypothetical protein
VKTVVVRALEDEDKAEALRAAARHTRASVSRAVFELDVQRLRSIPRTPFAYWVSEPVAQLFSGLGQFESDGRAARQGLSTADDFRFVRTVWELPLNERRNGWVPFAKGGAFSPFYADAYLAVNWRTDGREMKAWAGSRYNNSHWSRILKNTELFFRPGLTWPRRTQKGLSVRAMPASCIFADKGPAAFVVDDDRELMLSLLATLNSRAFRALVDLQMAFGSYEVGVIQRTPLPHIDQSHKASLAGRARRAWSLRRSLDTGVETSHAFVLSALLQVEGASPAERADGWAARVGAVEGELEEIQAEIDERCFELYGIEEADRRAISEGLVGATDDVEAEGHAGKVDETEEEQEAEADVDAAGLAAELVLWAVGVAFGRFDVRLATGERALPDEPEPFDPLPVCSPGMLVGDDGLPVTGCPPGYVIDFPESGVLVDDPGDARDLVAAVRAVFDAVFGAGADRWWDEAAALLDPRGHDLRAWLRSSFFERHLKLHSKSRRKAPILWQLGTLSGRYSIWLYAHRLTDDSFFRVQSDVVAPKLAYEERQLANLVQEAGGSPSGKQRREIDAQEAFVEELRLLLEEVRQVAPLWRPTLDDGIVLVMAPLWRLVPHKQWQRELKKKWSELATGKYDWAQLAMHLWPERVIPKCAEDRSLAIAHGLEDVFWEDDAGKWQPRQEPSEVVSELIYERTSTAVKDSLGAIT